MTILWLLRGLIGVILLLLLLLCWPVGIKPWLRQSIRVVRGSELLPPVLRVALWTQQSCAGLRGSAPSAERLVHVILQQAILLRRQRQRRCLRGSKVAPLIPCTTPVIVRVGETSSQRLLLCWLLLLLLLSGVILGRGQLTPLLVVVICTLSAQSGMHKRWNGTS